VPEFVPAIKVDHFEIIRFVMGGKYTTKTPKWVGNTPTTVLILSYNIYGDWYG
jgi:hypothetical protein